jgi:hypothetical protein
MPPVVQFDQYMSDCVASRVHVTLGQSACITVDNLLEAHLDVSIFALLEAEVLPDHYPVTEFQEGPGYPLAARIEPLS